jgi:hypothetical protein
VHRPDGVAGGPNASASRPEPGTFGQGKGPEAAAPAVSAVTPPDVEPAPAVEPAAPVAVQAPPVPPSLTVPPAAPSAPAVKSDPPTAVADPNDAPETSSDASPILLIDWSLPATFAVVFGAGAALVVPWSRRRQQASLPAGDPARSQSYLGTAPAMAHPTAGAPRPDDRLRTFAGAHSTIGDSIMQSATLRTMHPVENAYATAANVRLNGSPVPYLRPVMARADELREHGQQTDLETRPGYSTNVDGLSWSDPTTDVRGDRALA